LKRDLIQGSRPGGDRGPAIVAAAHLTDKPRPSVGTLQRVNKGSVKPKSNIQQRNRLLGDNAEPLIQNLRDPIMTRNDDPLTASLLTCLRMLAARHG